MRFTRQHLSKIKHHYLWACIEAFMLRLSTTRFLLDKPRLDYQPLPWIGIHEAPRSLGTKRRMSAIADVLSQMELQPGSVMDVGCNVGYFSLSLMERDWFVYGIDANERFLRIAKAASRRVKTEHGCLTTMNIFCNEETVPHLPHVDLTLCLSIWHHWVKHYGLDPASRILAGLWQKTRVALIFDAGEKEMSDDYALPFDNRDSKEWLEEYLLAICSGSRLDHLGVFPAFPPGSHEKVGEVQRNLFALTRAHSAPSS